VSDRIDVHHHFFPPAYLAAAGDEIARDAPALDRILGWTVERDLAEMDAHGITRALISIAPPAMSLLDAAAAKRLARTCNEFGARMVADHPERYTLLAVLPMPHVDETLDELAYAIEALRAVGVGLLSSTAGAWLGDLPYDPVLAELDRQDAIVHVHPNAAQVQPRLPGALFEFPFDTTRAIANFIASGAAAHYPRIRPIFSHGGGALAAILPRLLAFGRASPAMRAAAPDGVLPLLRRFYYDVALSARSAHLASLLDFLPADRLLFGTDAPFLPTAATLEQLADDRLDPALRSAIESENALALLSREAV
jgi:predicted TIM-barrel fold metal-dependent hydrolase